MESGHRRSQKGVNRRFESNRGVAAGLATPASCDWSNVSLPECRRDIKHQCDERLSWIPPAAMVTALYRAKRTNRQRTSGPTVGIENAQTTVAVIRAELELEGKFHGFSDLGRSRNCSAIQSINTRRRGDSWRVWEKRTWIGNGGGGKSASTSTNAPLASSELTR